MNHIKQHIIFKIITLLLVVSLLIPTVVKFTHIFSHHEHEVCLGEKTTHLHELDLDCSFYKFKLNNNVTFSFFNVDLISPQEEQFEILSLYSFLSKYQRLHFSLRGPPLSFSNILSS